MSVNNEIVEMIPLLVQGKLSRAEADRIEAEIAGSESLRAEFAFWQGIYSIRRSMPKFDFSGHPAVETLDRFALERINKLSSEYSEIAGHLQQCQSCACDVELLRLGRQAYPRRINRCRTSGKTELAVATCRLHCNFEICRARRSCLDSGS